jgi:hypothetical protein
MTDITHTTDSSISASASQQRSGLGGRPAAAQLTLEQRIANLEAAIDRLSVHAAQTQGTLSYLIFKSAVDAMSFIRCADDPDGTLQSYIEVATRNARKLQVADGLYSEIIQSGIDGALAEHVELLMRFASELPGGRQFQG